MGRIVGTALLLTLAAGGAFAATGHAPRLRIAATAPLTVAGTGFKAHERVRVIYTAEERTWTHRETASAAGAFTARFAGVRFVACDAHRLHAVGSMGTSAELKLPRPACPPESSADG